MGIREKMNDSPRLTVGVVSTIAVLATCFVVMQVLASRRTFPSKSPDSFFTIDDGQSFFVASSDNVPPFEYKGKQAVHAYVFECRGKRFVAYMDRYNPDARVAMVSGKATPDTVRFGRELKKPGASKWIKSGNPATEDPITAVVKCPEGHPDIPEAVEP